MFWIKGTVSIYCHRTNIHNDSCKVELGLSGAVMIFPIPNSF